jgi:hypothetical protein
VYCDFCHKYGFDPTARTSFPAFNDKLRQKNPSDSLRKQAYQAVCLYYEIVSVSSGQDAREGVSKNARSSAWHNEARVKPGKRIAKAPPTAEGQRNIPMARPPSDRNPGQLGPIFHSI